MVSTSPIARYVNTPTHNFQWAQEELGCIDLGDLRSERRLVSCFADMLNSPGKSIPQCTGSLKGTKAFYRLLDNDNLTAESLLAAHHQGALRRARASAEPVMLCIRGGFAATAAKPWAKALASNGTLITSCSFHA